MTLASVLFFRRLLVLFCLFSFNNPVTCLTLNCKTVYNLKYLISDFFFEFPPDCFPEVFHSALLFNNYSIIYAEVMLRHPKPERIPLFCHLSVAQAEECTQRCSTITHLFRVSFFIVLPDPLEEEMATHSSILAWRTPMDRGALQATVHGFARVGHDLATTPPPPPPSSHFFHMRTV